MEKMAESKHGQNKENAFFDKCRKLGAAIVTFDLLKTKHFNAIDFEKLMAATSIVKGAAFILYNVARLQTLLASFDQQVQSGFYDPLPEFGDVDFSLLKEEVCKPFQFVFVYFFLSSLFLLSHVDNIRRLFLNTLTMSNCIFLKKRFRCVASDELIFCLLLFFYDYRRSGRWFMFILLAFHRC